MFIILYTVLFMWWPLTVECSHLICPFFLLACYIYSCALSSVM